MYMILGNFAYSAMIRFLDRYQVENATVAAINTYMTKNNNKGDNS